MRKTESSPGMKEDLINWWRRGLEESRIRWESTINLIMITFQYYAVHHHQPGQQSHDHNQYNVVHHQPGHHIIIMILDHQPDYHNHNHIHYQHQHDYYMITINRHYDAQLTTNMTIIMSINRDYDVHPHPDNQDRTQL